MPILDLTEIQLGVRAQSPPELSTFGWGGVNWAPTFLPETLRGYHIFRSFAFFSNSSSHLSSQSKFLLYFCQFVNSISTSVSSVFFPAAAAGILRGPGGAWGQMSAQLESVLPAFPPQPSPVLSPPAGDQPLLPQILHHQQGVDGRCDQATEWEVL